MEYEALLQEISDFCAQTDMRDTTFGRAAKTDPYIIQRLRQGKDVRISTIKKLRAFMASYPTQETGAAA